jgi:hypothetical protein
MATRRQQRWASPSSRSTRHSLAKSSWRQLLQRHRVRFSRCPTSWLPRSEDWPNRPQNRNSRILQASMCSSRPLDRWQLSHLRRQMQQARWRRRSQWSPLRPTRPSSLESDSGRGTTQPLHLPRFDYSMGTRPRSLYPWKIQWWTTASTSMHN